MKRISGFLSSFAVAAIVICAVIGFFMTDLSIRVPGSSDEEIKLLAFSPVNDRIAEITAFGTKYNLDVGFFVSAGKKASELLSFNRILFPCSVSAGADRLAEDVSQVFARMRELALGLNGQKPE